jgi:hypothetical protein
MAVINQRSLIEARSGPYVAPTPAAPLINGPSALVVSPVAGTFAMQYTGTPDTWSITPSVAGVSVAAGVVSYPANFAGSINVVASNALGNSSQTVVVTQVPLPAQPVVTILDSALDLAVRSAASKSSQLQTIISRVPTKAVFSGGGVNRCEQVIASTTQSAGKLYFTFSDATPLAEGLIEKMTVYAGPTALFECSLMTKNIYKSAPLGMKIYPEPIHSVSASAGLPA